MPSYAITGAARGIGLALTAQLSEDASNEVFAVVRTPAAADELRALANTRRNLHILSANITSPQQLRDVTSAISDATGGSLDVLFENAAWVADGTAALTASAAAEEENLSRIRAAFVDAIDHNVIAMMSVTNTFLPLIRRGAGRRIIVLTTALADVNLTLAVGMTYHIPHSASKAAMNVVLAKMAIELQKQEIVLVGISPGWVSRGEQVTDQEKARLEYQRQLFRNIRPDLERQLSPAESASMVLKVAENVTLHQAGRMLSHTGTDEWLSKFG